MYLFKNIYLYIKSFFEYLSFRTRPKDEIFYDNDSSNTEYESIPLKYEFILINEKMDR